MSAEAVARGRPVKAGRSAERVRLERHSSGTPSSGPRLRTGVLLAAVPLILVGCSIEPNEDARLRAGGTVSTVTAGADAGERLLELEARWLEAVRDRDRAALDTLLADELVMTSPEGGAVALGKRALIDLYTGPVRLDSFRIRGPVADVDGGTGTVRYGLLWYGAFDGEPWTETFRMTDLWIYRDGRWQVLARVGRSVAQDGAGDDA